MADSPYSSAEYTYQNALRNLVWIKHLRRKKQKAKKNKTNKKPHKVFW